MDSSQGESSKRRKISAGSRESTAHSNSERLKIKELLKIKEHVKFIERLGTKNTVFMQLYEDQYKQNVNPTEVNALCGENGQTATCARKALDAYNKRNGTNYKLEEGGDSNVLVPSSVVLNLVFYVHLNFYASHPTKGRHTFFAELVAVRDKEPHDVTVVVMLGSSDDEVEANSAEHNCWECTGLRHPLAEANEKRFKGFRETGL